MVNISPDDSAQFVQDGFLIVENIIDEQTIESLRHAFDQMFDGQFETGILPDEVNWQSSSGDPSLTRQICNGWKANRHIAATVLRADLGESIAQLGNWPGTRIMSDNVLWKPAGTRPLGYHQDSSFLSWYTPSDLITCWIALDDTNANGGTLEFVRGSHRWHHTPPEGEFHGPADYQKHMQQAAQREGVKPDIVHVEVSKGGGSFHHGWTWHGSGYNNSDQPRRALVLHGMRSDVEYNPDNLHQGTGPVYSRYKRLLDNQIDENYFPVLWRNDGYRTDGIDHYFDEL